MPSIGCRCRTHFWVVGATATSSISRSGTGSRIGASTGAACPTCASTALLPATPGATSVTTISRCTKLAKVVDGHRMRRVVEWGCGGGANAAAFAPHCDEYVGVDVAETQLKESARQVAQVCDTRFTPILVEVGNPEAALDLIPGRSDLFLCLYVLELVPRPDYGLRVLRIAHDLLSESGLAFVQIKYSTRSWRTLPRRRRYASHLADMTTYPIDEFWTAAERCGLRPEAVHIVPKTAVDERYAYFLLSRSAAF